jgi:hypothetical protein
VRSRRGEDPLAHPRPGGRITQRGTGFRCSAAVDELERVLGCRIEHDDVCRAAADLLGRADGSHLQSAVSPEQHGDALSMQPKRTVNGSRPIMDLVVRSAI